MKDLKKKTGFNFENKRNYLIILILIIVLVLLSCCCILVYTTNFKNNIPPSDIIPSPTLGVSPTITNTPEETLSPTVTLNPTKTVIPTKIITPTQTAVVTPTPTVISYVPFNITGFELYFDNGYGGTTCKTTRKYYVAFIPDKTAWTKFSWRIQELGTNIQLFYAEYEVQLTANVRYKTFMPMPETMQDYNQTKKQYRSTFRFIQPANLSNNTKTLQFPCYSNL